jgi:cell division protein FtsA
MLDNYICALDIGSSKIAGCVAQTRGKSINNMFFDSMPSKGIKEGTVVDSINLVSVVSKLLNNLKAKSGIKIKHVYVNISGNDIVTKHSRAVVPLAEKGNKVITQSDILKANEQARILGSSLEEEIIHLVPSSYAIDSKSEIQNPLGLYSHRLEVDLYLICVKLSSLQSLSRVIHQSGYEIKDLFLSGVATSRAVLYDEIKEGINLLCDIGSDMTEILLFNKGILSDIEILAKGGEDFTNKLSEELKIPFELAEDIKRSYGVIGDLEDIGRDKEILVKKNDLYKPIKQQLVSEIVTDCAKSICSSIKEAVYKKVSCHEVNNFIAVGRAIALEGFIETLENTLSFPVKLGRIANPKVPAFIKEDSLLAGQKYFMYLTSLGIVLEAIGDKTAPALSAGKPTKNIFVRAINRFKEVYQEYF